MDESFNWKNCPGECLGDADELRQSRRPAQVAIKVLHGIYSDPKTLELTIKVSSLKKTTNFTIDCLVLAPQS
jgi:hypothetical protein